jgi:hypothetical protein
MKLEYVKAPDGEVFVRVPDASKPGGFYLSRGGETPAELTAEETAACAAVDADELPKSVRARLGEILDEVS